MNDLSSGEKSGTPKNSGKEAVILLGHGSRVPDAGKNMEKVALSLSENYGYQIVEVCYMSRLGPHFPETFRKCVGLGAARVTVIPYFLNDGLHIVLDIPSVIQKTANEFPQVETVLGNHLGFDDVLVDLVARRKADAKDCCDVKDLALPARSKYPVPPGQQEFVPMTPEDAAKYFERDRKNHH